MYVDVHIGTSAQSGFLETSGICPASRESAIARTTAGWFGSTNSLLSNGVAKRYRQSSL
jgi:hypothetical protein